MKLSYSTAFLLILFFTNNTNASQYTSHQLKPETSSMYLSAGIGWTIAGNNTGISFNHISSKSRGFALKYDANYRTAKSLPADYVSGICVFGDCTPMDKYYAVAATLIREFPGKFRFLRLGVEAGPSMGIYQKANFSSKLGGGGWFGSNYNTRYSKTTSPGLTMRASTSLLLTTFTGLELAAISNLNIHQPYLGIELRLIFGKLRGKK